MGSNTFTVIKYEDIPLNKHGDICHSCIVCKVQPKKDDPNKIRITIAGGNTLCPGEVAIPTGSLKTHQADDEQRTVSTWSSFCMRWHQIHLP